jgi:hypothetical protein
MNCSIEESTMTPGYSATYVGNGINGGCSWEDIEDGFEGTCEVTNSPDAVEIVVTKNWVIEGDNNDVDLDYGLYAYCNNVFVEDDAMTEGAVSHNTQVGYAGSAGPSGGEFVFTVRPGFPSSSCYVNENVYDSAIEVSNGCRNLVVSANEGTACTITNTVFFEGIPTLSQYGMAIMALLMLGVGFVGFRRFV